MFNMIQPFFEALLKIFEKSDRKKTEKEKIFSNFKHELKYNQKLIRDGKLFFEFKNDALEEIFRNTHLFPNVKVLYSLRYAYYNISIYLEESKGKNYDKKEIPEGIKNLFETSSLEIISFKPELILNPTYDSSLPNKKKSKFRYKGAINWNKLGTIITSFIFLFVIFGFLGFSAITDFIPEDITETQPDLSIEDIRWAWEDDTLIFFVTYKNGGEEQIEISNLETEYLGDNTVIGGPFFIAPNKIFTERIRIENKKFELQHVLRSKVNYKNFFEKNGENYCFQTYFKHDNNPGKLAAIINQTVCN